MLGNGNRRAPCARSTRNFSFGRWDAVGCDKTYRLCILDCQREAERNLWSSARRKALQGAIVLASLVIFGAIPTAHAQQCTTNPSNGGVLQSGGTCVDNNPVTTGFGTAVDASNSASVTENGTVTANGGGTGISATTHAVVTENSNVSAAGIGLSAASGGTIVANGITLGNTGGGAMAMLANDGTIIANGITVTYPNGFGSALVDATNGGLIEFAPNSSITVPSGGFGTAVILSDGATSRITADGLTVSITSGSGGINAFKAQGGGNISLANSTINNSVSSTGGGDTGLWATGAGSAITANNVNLSVGGSGGDFGVRADTNGSVTMTGGSVSVINGAGGLLQNGGSVTVSGTNVTASGSGGIGFLFNNGGSADTLNYSNGTITASNASFSVQGSAANIGLTDAIAIANNNTLLATGSSGNTAFDARGSTLQGVITTDASSTSAVNLTQATVWTMTGNSNATNVTNNDSEIIYTQPTGDPTQLSSYKTLTANNYVGTGGTIALNTYLANDSAPSDRLVINSGTATGSTSVKITNSGGPGDETVANGILVVQTLNNATTTAGAFSLLGEVRGGAYSYFLFRGGLNGNAPQDWFLRSTFLSPNTPVPPIGTVPPPDLVEPPSVLPAEPPPSTLPPGQFPIIGPELATYGAVQPIARQMGLATLGTLNQRIGDSMTALNAATDRNGWGRSDWARVFGQQIDGHYQAFADPRSDGWLAGFQGGIDLWRGSTIAGHRDSAGVYFAYTQASANITGLVTNPSATGYMLTRTGTNEIESWSAGGYWTHYGPTGWYLDAILQGTLYRGNATTQFAQLPLKGTGFAASLETGYPITLPLGSGFVLEPQAQIIWQRVQFDDADDGLGPVGLGTTSGPIGRLGLRGQWNFEGRNGMLWQPYVGTNYWRSWGAEATTDFGIDQVQLLEKMETVEAFVGITGKLDRNYSVYAQAGYQFDVGSLINAGPQGVKGTTGIRYSW
jgi:outer membrane autotransporter protein